MMMNMDEDMHKKWHMKKAIGMLILGILVLINTYAQILTWEVFIGALLVIGGILKLVMPHKCC